MIRVAHATSVWLCLALFACGSESSSPPSTTTTTTIPTSTAPQTPATPSVPAAPQTEEDAGTPTPTPSGEPGVCVPNADCNGISSCVDHCYGDRCCYLGCNCDTSTGRLSCGLDCD